MIKCPNCGSGAQVTLEWMDEEMYTDEHYREYSCGCGCVFQVTFIASHSTILNDE